MWSVPESGCCSERCRQGCAWGEGLCRPSDTEQVFDRSHRELSTRRSFTRGGASQSQDWTDCQAQADLPLRVNSTPGSSQKESISELIKVAVR